MTFWHRTFPLWTVAPVALLVLAPFITMQVLDEGVLITAFSKDIFISLGSAWRVWNGQMPHLDFPTPVGGLYFALLHMGMQIEASAKLVTWSNLIVLLFLVPSALWICHRRFPSWMAVLFTLAVSLLVISPRLLDGTHEVFALVAPYNRIGWALFNLLLVAVLVPPRRRFQPLPFWADALDGVIIGVLVLATFYIKISFTLMAGAALVLALLRIAHVTRAVLLAIPVLILGMVLVELSFGLHGAYLSNLSQVAGMTSLSNVIQLGKIPMMLSHGQEMLWGAAILVLARMALVQGSTFVRLFDPFVMAAFFALGSGVLLAMQNRDLLIGTLPAMAWIVFEGIRRIRAMSLVRLSHLLTRQTRGHDLPPEAAHTSLKNSPDPLALPPAPESGAASENTTLIRTNAIMGSASAYLMAIAVLAVVPILKPTVADGRAIVTHHLSLPLVLGSPLSEESHSPLRTLYFTDEKYRSTLQQGAKLLEEHLRPGERIWTTDFSNPFPFWLKQPPPKRDLLWWDLSRTFSEETHPPAGPFLCRIDLIAIPKKGTNRNVVQMEKIYKAHIEQRFTRIAETDAWAVWRHNDNDEQCRFLHLDAPPTPKLIEMETTPAAETASPAEETAIEPMRKEPVILPGMETESRPDAKNYW
ncbi:MAG: hypothetical protein HQL50_05640 [Magnetococcales bacterium]|nr:hypothetical protein [Magnetococcales bacterium]